MTPHDLPLARTGFERAAEERATEGLLASTRADAATRVLVLHGDAAPLAAPDRLAYAPPADVTADAAVWAFLGRDADGTAVLAAVLDADAPRPGVPAPAGWGSLREVGGGLDARDAGAFVAALSLGRWLLDAAFCPACGTRTEVRHAGWSRHCPACGREHFPRTDPAVIVAVGSPDGERLLLGSNALWGQDRYSCFAGFVEAGESLEAAVAREVGEESGVALSGIRYAGSQAWPYPRSLMLGFSATARDEAAARPDGEEILQVRWFTRPEIAEALAGRGGVTLPGPSSIARALIEAWLAEVA
jgi:NAD+ diphosphatase